MELKQFIFEASFFNEPKQLSVTVPVTDDGFVRTDKYCPRELFESSAFPFTPMIINGELVQGFIEDCRMLSLATQYVQFASTRIDIFIGALLGVVANHIGQYHRIIFRDLLLYVDCICFLLEADGTAQNEIQKMYPSITLKVVDYCIDYVKTNNLEEFRGSAMEKVLRDLARG